MNIEVKPGDIETLKKSVNEKKIAHSLAHAYKATSYTCLLLNSHHKIIAFHTVTNTFTLYLPDEVGTIV